MIPTRSNFANAPLRVLVALSVHKSVNLECSYSGVTKQQLPKVEALIAMERCGPDSSIAELTDFICAAQMAKVADALLPVEDRKPLYQITQRTLPEDAIRPPYFYYENVALAPVRVWIEMSLSAKLIERIRKTLEAYDDEPPSSVQKYVLDEFPKHHTRGGGSARDMFPGGINVMSVFSGISDAKVAFYCLGIPLKTDAQELNYDQLEQLMSIFGEFDFVVGAIQCNNLSEEINIIRMDLKIFGFGEFSCNNCYDFLFCFSKIYASISHTSRTMERFG
ncbi:hypothetical protein F3Y22_tig00005974pilonHSYRG00444 [Hibiscus syriacus]|uniref:Uncharacterized protein n=1 Tax=Hibiscus syriacus TaxID=106335 RepID=A0A6A3CHD7_HIBSY|nr:hypothetical protein F3Y22_tig00005974pilonHSYRG00444 [Hibiscus syriacus]